MTYALHIAINRWRWGHRRQRRPFGAQTEHHGISLRCDYPQHPYVVSSTCRAERDKWHNRVHHAEARYIATSHGQVLEYGFGACGAYLINPLYLDAPIRLCDCGNGEASICPRCEMVAHPAGLAVCSEPALFAAPEATA